MAPTLAATTPTHHTLAPRPTHPGRAYDGGMRIVLTGATGYIGSSVLAALVARGHDVIAPVRSEASAATATNAGASAVVGDITDPGWFTPLLHDADAAIHRAASRAGDGARNL